MNPWLPVAAALLAAVCTAGGALLGARMNTGAGDRATEQREAQGRREEWSKRFLEILAYAVDESPRKRTAGLELLAALADSELAGPDERKLMYALTDRVLNPLLREIEKDDLASATPELPDDEGRGRDD
ncbi:hypothetical protein FKR81_03180 [Lentzea tibetensis]|uniref:Uncharacterized protein n=1 Tax=Lentzea tibetensis TaxID=2591470 RepID=A0A563F1J5_9PSEU|nr:hypothetical protein [Lentzea tibetensis]TWP53773.1 hypothetical protein FKR81_03180 [Lentzea tibetensis]